MLSSSKGVLPHSIQNTRIPTAHMSTSGPQPEAAIPSGSETNSGAMNSGVPPGSVGSKKKHARLKSISLIGEVEDLQGQASWSSISWGQEGGKRRGGTGWEQERGRGIMHTQGWVHQSQRESLVYSGSNPSPERNQKPTLVGVIKGASVPRAARGTHPHLSPPLRFAVPRPPGLLPSAPLIAPQQHVSRAGNH